MIDIPPSCNQSMQQSNSTRISHKTEDIGPLSFDEAWKAVGSHSRRGSLAGAIISNSNINGTTADKQSPATSPTPTPLSAQRRPSLDPSQWGFQWDGFFDNETRKPSFSHLPPTADETTYALHRRSMSFAYDNNILSVPMLPNVSTEPIYRQQRSLSFSVGQDPTFFGYDDYQDAPSRFGNNEPNPMYGYKNSLATMEEEQDDDDILQDRINQELTAARTRSQSSGAVFGLLSQQNDALRQLRRGSEQHDDLSHQPRRSSRFFGDGTLPGYPQQQNRLSQPQTREYKFPDQNYNLRLAHPHQIQQLSEQLENTSLYTNEPMQTHHRSSPPEINYRQPSSNYSYLAQQPSHINSQQNDMEHQRNNTANSLFQDTGKGVPLQRLPKYIPLYAVEFKAGRMEYFYVISEQPASGIRFQIGDLVIVEGDRGKDLGKVASNALSIAMVEQYISQQQERQQEDTNADDKPKDTYIKRLHRLATPDENILLIEKEKDERKALEHCQQKTKMRQLPMVVVDAEYQWDRRKLTFFFVSDRRIDFRELVRELFKHYKTRIWMCAVKTEG